MLVSPAEGLHRLVTVIVVRRNPLQFSVCGSAHHVEREEEGCALRSRAYARGGVFSCACHHMSAVS